MVVLPFFHNNKQTKKDPSIHFSYLLFGIFTMKDFQALVVLYYFVFRKSPLTVSLREPSNCKTCRGNNFLSKSFSKNLSNICLWVWLMPFLYCMFSLSLSTVLERFITSLSFGKTWLCFERFVKNKTLYFNYFNFCGLWHKIMYIPVGYFISRIWERL